MCGKYSINSPISALGSTIFSLSFTSFIAVFKTFETLDAYAVSCALFGARRNGSFGSIISKTVLPNSLYSGPLIMSTIPRVNVSRPMFATARRRVSMFKS